MKVYYSLIWSVVASLTSQNVLPRSTDPVADECSPLCSDKTALALEEDCGELLGCPELDLEEDPDAILACWTPCFAAVEDCFNLCAQRFDDILQMCYNDCGQQENPVDCIAVCFNASFTDFRNSLQRNQDNSTGDANSEVSEAPEVNTPQTQTLINSDSPNSEDASIEISEDIDIAMPIADIDTDNRFHPKYMHDALFNLNDTLELYKSFHNNTTNVDVSDSNNVIKVNTFLSRLFPYILYSKLRILMKTYRSDKNNRGLQSRNPNQHKETTNHHIAEGNLSTTPSIKSPDNEVDKITLTMGADFLDHRTTKKQRDFQSWVGLYNKIIDGRLAGQIKRSRRNVYENFLHFKTDNSQLGNTENDGKR